MISFHKRTLDLVSSSMPRPLPNIGSSSIRYVNLARLLAFHLTLVCIAGLNHFLRRLCANDVLPWCHAMDHQELVCVAFTTPIQVFT